MARWGPHAGYSLRVPVGTLSCGVPKRNYVSCVPVAVGDTMPDHLAKAKRYRERANECRHLAKLAASPQAQKDFEKLASYYDQLAQEEAARVSPAN